MFVFVIGFTFFFFLIFFFAHRNSYENLGRGKGMFNCLLTLRITSFFIVRILKH